MGPVFFKCRFIVLFFLVVQRFFQQFFCSHNVEKQSKTAMLFTRIHKKQASKQETKTYQNLFFNFSITKLTGDILCNL